MFCRKKLIAKLQHLTFKICIKFKYELRKLMSALIMKFNDGL
jgi:hypothetical protein